MRSTLCGLVSRGGLWSRVFESENYRKVGNVPPEIMKALLEYHSRLGAAFSSIDVQSLGRLVNLLLDCRLAGNTVLLAGNGGSASTVNHFAIDWMLGSGLANPGLPVVSLAESSSSLTATANDMSFDQVFARQVTALGRPGDLLIVVSASGNSRNLIDAVSASRDAQMTSLSITAFDGGFLKDLADENVHVQTDHGDYGVAEDCHLAIGHMVKEALVHHRLAMSHGMEE